MAATKPVHFSELLKDAPKNWGRFGPNDEIGALNFLTSAEVLRGVRAVKSGQGLHPGRAGGAAGGRPALSLALAADSHQCDGQGLLYRRQGASRSPAGWNTPTT